MYFFSKIIFIIQYSNIVVSLYCDTFGKYKQNCTINISSSHLYDKWSTIVVLLREYKNISNMSLQIHTTSLSNVDVMKK